MFEPFGFRFEIKTTMPLAAARAAIRARKKPWLEVKGGARGWIVGRFICLWMSAFDVRGPMLLAWMSTDGSSTIVRGRAGSDLNGLFWASFLIVTMFLIMGLRGELIGFFLYNWPITFFFVLIISLVLWFSHQDRREAEPLVRFLRDAITASGQSLRARSGSQKLAKSITMHVNGEKYGGPATMAAIHDALLSTGVDDFVVLATGDENYIQSVMHDKGFVLEKREGSSDRHFKAVRRTGAESGNGEYFTFEEILAAFAAFATQNPEPSEVEWRPIKLV